MTSALIARLKKEILYNEQIIGSLSERTALQTFNCLMCPLYHWTKTQSTQAPRKKCPSPITFRTQLRAIHPNAKLEDQTAQVSMTFMPKPSKLMTNGSSSGGLESQLTLVLLAFGATPQASS